MSARSCKGATMFIRVVCLVLALVRVAEAGPHDRTIVIFGDTQELVDGAAGEASSLVPADPDGRENLENFATMVDWVLANRQAENIDFVLHVGDIIQSGMFLPNPPIAECFVDGECQGEFEYVEGETCPCRLEVDVDLQWRRFNREWRRLAGVIPYAIVRGNHDNIGGLDAGDRAGFRDYFGASVVSALPGYKASSTFNDVAHVWKFDLGPFPVLVLTLPDGAHQDPGQRNWAREQLSRKENRGLPVILLAHRLFHGVPVDYQRPLEVWTEIVEEHPEQIFMTVSGHVSPGSARMLDRKDRPLLDVRADWQVFNRGPDAALLTLIRLRLGPDGIESATVEVVSPTGKSEAIPRFPAFQMPTRQFVVPLANSTSVRPD